MSGVKQTRSSHSSILFKNGAFGISNGESITKMTDSSSEGDNSGTDKLFGDKINRFQYDEVRFTPCILQFFDAFQGKQFSEKFTIQNVGRNPVFIKIGEPTSFIFQMKKPSRRKIFLAAGASITRTITYTYHSDDMVQKSRIPVYINGRQIDYPILVKKAMPELEIEPSKVDFGTINLGSEVKTLILTISNKGGARTKYEIDVGKNDLDLVVNPLKGTVKAKDQVKVIVELMGMQEGEFFKEIWIKTNEIPIRVPVLVEVIRPRLLVVYPNGTEELSAIDFPPTFSGSQRAVPFVLKNRSSEIALFVTVGEVNGEYQFLNEARKNHKVFNFFHLTAEEGRLQPHESRVLTALFRPTAIKKTKGWRNEEKVEKNSQTEHVVFFKMSRVHSIERREIEKACGPYFQEENRKNSDVVRVNPESSSVVGTADQESIHAASIDLLEDHESKESGFRLCLRGILVKPEILLQPSKFYFDEITLGQTEQRVLTITNKSIIRVKCVVLKKVNVTVIPKECWIGPEKIHEFSLRVTPSCSGIFRHTVKIQILGESDVVYATDEPLSVIAEYQVGVSFTALNTKKFLVPKFGLGITPLITDEVGINKELATFSNADEVPYAAKLLSLNEEFKPLWMRMKSADVDNAIIAFPNDRPRGFQTWPKNKICRTIFKGWLRYAPPKDTAYTFSSQEEIARVHNNAIWNKYFLMIREIREALTHETRDCIETLDSCYTKGFHKFLKSELCQKSQLPTPKIKRKDTASDSWDFLIPLSPMFLSYVFVEPKMINYGAVAVNSPVSANLKINNRNVFPVAINFIPGNSAVTVNEGTVNVQSDAEKTITIWFQSGILGRYYGFLNYVINGSHQFKITISAFVMSRTLNIEPKSLTFGSYPSHQAFQPRTLFLSLENWLQTSISYRFQYSADSSYFSVLEKGQIPPKSTLLSEVVVGLHPKKPHSAELLVTSESGEKELLKINRNFKKLAVKFLTKRIDLKHIPLNLKTKVPLIVENECFHDVTFELTDGSPMPGVTVEPRFGVIKARSFFLFEVQIQIPVVMKFTFEIHMIVQTMYNISVQVDGNVVLPNIRIKPSVINMRRICAHSFDTVKICIENVGTTPSEVEIDFRTCPEYKVLSGNSQVYLYPKETTSMVILFEPKDATRFIFYLPVIVNKILGPPLMQEAETEKVSFYISDLEETYGIYGEVRDVGKSGEKIPLAVLNCTVSSSLITVTPQSITFQRQETMEESLEALNDYGSSKLYFPSKSLVISNDGTDDVTFCLRNDDLGRSNDSPFDLEPVDPEKVEYRLKSMKATLQPGEQLAFKATFSPKKPGQYSVRVPVYVRGYNNGIVYCYIDLSGALNKPNLISEAEEIHFYPTPLDVSSECTFGITAENYYSADTISCLICQPENTEINAVPSLSITWLETPEVTKLNNQQKFKVQITFRSSVPVALKCYLVFVDSKRNFCSVLVTAIADNSSVTAHIFLNVNSVRYKIVRRDCTPPVWKADERPILPYPFDKSQLYNSEKSERKSYDIEPVSFAQWQMLDKGPSLVVQGPWSIFNVGLKAKKKTSDDSSMGLLQDSQLTFSDTSPISMARSLQSKVSFNRMDITYPSYPNQEDIYKGHCDNTLQYVERWIYEVVMRCDQYFMIPTSFKIFKTFSKTKGRTPKDVIDFLSEIYDSELFQRLEYVEDEENPINWATRLFEFYNKILERLASQGCFLPQIRAEYLLPYEEYRCFVEHVNNSDTVKPIKADARTNAPEKFSYQALHSKAKQDAVDLPKTNSYASSKDWFSEKSSLDALTLSSEADLEKDHNADLTDLISNPDEVFEHVYEVMEENEHNRRLTQAWLDIIIQIFRHSVLKKIVYKSTIPEVQVIEFSEKVPVEIIELSKVSLYGGSKDPMAETYISNVYSVQERMLLLWLNHHLNVQRKQMWANVDGDDFIPEDKFISNFHKDLNDSLALISVTASYCPYVIPEYFRDCFPKPDTPDKFYHNAARLVLAWRELGIGLTVETMDIVKPNSIFMVMLVAQLYEVLPSLHPRYLVCFEGPLSSYQSKKFLVQCHSGKIFIQPKLLGEDSRYFKLNQTSQLELQKGKAQEIKLTFFAKKIKKVKATLLLSGCEESPYFGKGLAFFLDGQLTELTESEKLSFSVPLYKVVCSEISIRPPYSESASYEIWYSTIKPELSDCSDLVVNFKPWSKIWFRKVCRRLFLNKNEVSFSPEQQKIFLSVTVSCFTQKERLFWLLFRSKTADFIVRIKIKPKIDKRSWPVVPCYYPNKSPVCSCAKTNKGLRINWADLKSCPLITVLKVPSRNDELWNSLKTMFLKSILPQETAFWAEYFEKDIGLCIIRWLLSPDEEKEVVDEFIPLLQTQITYKLSATKSRKYLKMPSDIEIKDVRQETEIVIPIHVTKMRGADLEMEMTSESELEVRKVIVQVNVLENFATDSEKSEESTIRSSACQPCKNSYLGDVPSNPCRKLKKFAKHN